MNVKLTPSVVVLVLTLGVCGWLWSNFSTTDLTEVSGFLHATGTVGVSGLAEPQPRAPGASDSRTSWGSATSNGGQSGSFVSQDAISNRGPWGRVVSRAALSNREQLAQRELAPEPETGGGGAAGSDTTASTRSTSGAAAASNTAASATLQFIGVNQNGSQTGGSDFSGDLGNLMMLVRWKNLSGTHSQRLELWNPNGFLYKSISTEFAGTPVETGLPVAGTWITEYSLLGAWRVDVYLDDGQMPVTSGVFVLNP